MRHSIQNLIYRIIGVGFKQGANIVIFFIAAKILTPHDFGLYNYLFAFALALAILSDFGVSTAVAKYVAKHKALNSAPKKAIIGSAVVVVIGVSTLLAFGLLAAHSFVRIDTAYLLPLFVIIYSMPLFSVFDGAYRGEHDNKALAYAAGCGAVVAITGSLFLIDRFGIIGALVSQIVFYMVGIFIFVLRYKSPIFEVSTETMRDVARISIPLGMIGLVYLAYARMDTILLGLFGYTIEVGYYEVVNKVILLLSLPIQIFAQVEAPRMVALWHTARLKVAPLVRKHLFISIPIFVFSAAGTYLIVPTLLRAFFGEYANETVYIMLGALLIAYVFQATSDLIGNVFTVATDHEKLNLYILTIFAVANLCFVYFGIKYFGPVGIAYAKIAVYAPYTIIFLSLYLRHLRRVDPTINVDTAKSLS